MPESKKEKKKVGSKPALPLALVIGINKYPGSNALYGCVNDAEDFIATYKSQKPSATVFKLYDFQATRSRILSYMNVVSSGSPGLVYYSGHGSQVADIHGDEIDRLDETIVPIDYGRSGMITDDEIQSVVSGHNIEIITDCCHSGTNTRFIRDLTKDERVKMIDIGYGADLSVPVLRMRDISKAVDKDTNTDNGNVYWGACQDNQYSYEVPIGGKPRGVFTYNFCKKIRSNPTATRSQILDSVNRSIGQYQVPALTCSTERKSQKIFG